MSNAYIATRSAPGEEGLIALRLWLEWEGAVLEIRDNGHGLTRPTPEGGSGMELLKAFAGQLGGRWSNEPAAACGRAGRCGSTTRE